MCRQAGELRPPGAGGAGLSDLCLPGEMEWTYYKLDSIPGKS